MTRKTAGASIEIVSKDGPMDVNTMVREGLNALVKTFNDQNFWKESLLEQADNNDSHDTPETHEKHGHHYDEQEERDYIERFEQNLALGKPALEIHQDGAKEANKTNKNSMSVHDVLKQLNPELRGLVSDDIEFASPSHLHQQQQKEAELMKKHLLQKHNDFLSKSNSIQDAPITETELVIDYNEGDIGMEELNAAIYEKFTDLLNASLDDKNYFDQWIQHEDVDIKRIETLDELQPSETNKSKKKKSKKKKKKTKNKNADAKETVIDINITNEGPYVHPVSPPLSLDSNRVPEYDHDLQPMLPETHSGPVPSFSRRENWNDDIHSRNDSNNEDTQTAYAKVDPIDELAALTEAKLRSLLPEEILSSSTSLAKQQGDMSERPPNFSYLAYIDEPLCYFCEYFLVFGELPVNTIKSYYKKMSSSNSVPGCPHHTGNHSHN